MDHFRKNLEQAQNVSRELLEAVEDERWTDVPGLIAQRDKAVEIAFPENLPVAYHAEAQKVFSLINTHQETVLSLSTRELSLQKDKNDKTKKGKKVIQSYLSP